MKIVLQRVKEAGVSVGGTEKAKIEKGLLLLVGVGRNDTGEVADFMAQKITKLRVFEDDKGKMNLDIREIGGEVLSIPQFTLQANTDKGNRPGFDYAADPKDAKSLWEKFNEALKLTGLSVAEGEFGAHMEVSLVNDGPVTFIIDSADKFST